MENNVEKNKQILIDAVKRIGKSRLPFDEKDINTLANSKSFDFVDYLKKMIILNRSIDSDVKMEIETDLTNEYKSMIQEISDIEDEGNDLSKNKRYNNIKSKTDSGLSFFLMQGYFQTKTLNKITKQNPDIEYKLDNEIERRSRRSMYYKTDKNRAVCNSIVNTFRDEFPKAKSIGLNKSTLFMDNEGQSGSKIAAKSIAMLCENGVLSTLVDKITNRIDNFNKKFKIPESISNNNIFSNTKNIMAIAASAVVVAFFGNEGLELMSTPMPPIADLGIREVIQVFASVEIPEMTSNIIPEISNHLGTASDIQEIRGVDLSALNMADAAVVVSEQDKDILNFLSEKENIQVIVEQGKTLTDIAKEQLTDPSDKNIQNFISAVSEYNDIDNPNFIIENSNVDIPPADFLETFKSNIFEITATNKKEILEQMKNVNIEYGETQSTLVEKLTEGMKDSGILKPSQLTSFKTELLDSIPVDLKAFDENVSKTIKSVVENFEKLQNKSQFKMK